MVIKCLLLELSISRQHSILLHHHRTLVNTHNHHLQDATKITNTQAVLLFISSSLFYKGATYFHLPPNFFRDMRQNVTAYQLFLEQTVHLSNHDSHIRLASSKW